MPRSFQLTDARDYEEYWEFDPELGRSVRQKRPKSRAVRPVGDVLAPGEYHRSNWQMFDSAPGQHQPAFEIKDNERGQAWREWQARQQNAWQNPDGFRTAAYTDDWEPDLPPPNQHQSHQHQSRDRAAPALTADQVAAARDAAWEEKGEAQRNAWRTGLP